MRNSTFRFLAFCFVFSLLAVSAWAQNTDSAQAKHVHPFVHLPDVAHPSVQEYLRNSHTFSIQRHILTEWYQNPAQDVVLTLPDAYPGLTELRLHRVDNLIADLVLTAKTAAGDVRHPLRSIYVYHGTVVGRPGTRVAVTLCEGQLIILASTPEGDFTLAPYADQPNGDHYLFFNDIDWLVQRPGECHTDHSNIQPTPHVPTSRATTCRTVRVYFECGVDMYTDFGSNLQAVGEHTVAFFAMVNLLYEDFDMWVEISEIGIHTTTATDPAYPGPLGTAATLANFETDMAGGFNGDLAHYISTAASLAGGIANLITGGVFCSTANNRTAVSGINTSFPPIPSFGWTVEVVSHEMGHNFGSPHTQQRGFWGAGLERFDDCYTDEGAGNNTSINNLVGGGNTGSIMSYCHLCADKCGTIAPNFGGIVGISFTTGFGTLPGQLIGNNFNTSTCVACPCRDAYEPNNSRLTASDIFGTLAETVIDNTLSPTLHNVGDDDYYRLNVTQNGNITLTLSTLSENFSLFLQDNTGAVVASSTNPGTANESIAAFALTAGNVYYVRVAPATGRESHCTPHRLRMQWAPSTACTSAGMDSTISVCNTFAALNLFTLGLGGNPSDGTGSWTDNNATGALTGNNLNTTGLAAGDYTFTYTLAAGGGCPVRAATVTVKVADCTPTCIANYNDNCATGVFLESFYLWNANGDFDGTEGAPVCAEYSDKRATPVAGVLTLCGSTATANVGIQYNGCWGVPAANAYTAVMVDWNQNGTFEVGERYEITEGLSVNTPSGTLSCGANILGGNTTITVPGGTQAGTYLLRAMFGFLPGTGNPCGTYQYGEAEDYLLEIAETPSLTAYAVTPATQTTCLNGYARIVLPNSQQGVSYRVFEGATPLGTAQVSRGGDELVFLISGLSVGAHTLKVVANNGCATLDMANTVSVTVSNSVATGPSTENDPGQMLQMNLAGVSSQQFVWVPNDPLLNLSSGAFTVSAWVQPTALGAAEQIIISKDQFDDANIDYQIGIRDVAGNRRFFARCFSGTNTTTGTTNLVNGEWYHVTLVKSGSTITLFVNGVNEATSGVMAGSAAVSSTQPLTIGRRTRTCGFGTISTPGCSGTDPAYFRGYIDEVVLRNVALTQQQIREQMHLVCQGCGLGVVAYWQMNATGDTLLSAYNGIPAYRMNDVASAPSTLPVGYGVSNTLTAPIGASNRDFTGTDVIMDFNSNTVSMPVVVTRIDLPINPNTTQPATSFPALQNVFNTKYWVVNTFPASPSVFDVNVTYSGIAGVLAADQATPSNLKLVRRTSRAYGAWASLTDAVSYSGGTQSITINGITGFSQTALATITATPLPVEQLVLTATPVGNDVRLDWTTAQEINNWGFFVEMQRPGGSFFEGMGFVNGNGTMAQPSNYAFTVPSLTPGTYLFRLRQVDFDGTVAYSQTVEASIAPPAFSADVRVYPNPNAGTFTVEWGGAEAASIRLVNVLGQVVWTGQQTGPRAELTLPLPQGIYTLQVQTAEGRVLNTKVEILGNR